MIYFLRRETGLIKSDTRRFENEQDICPDCGGVGFSDYATNEPGYVYVECWQCGECWLERWQPENIIPPYNSEEDTA